MIQLRNCTTGEYSWINPTPQSVRFCRPLWIALEKEDNVATREYNRLNHDIKSLKPHEFRMCNEKSVKVTFNMSQTMFDGKCINNIIENKASSKCPLCLRTAHEFGKLSDPFTVKKASLELGLEILHAEIKAFEHLLHISYRIQLRTWDVRKHLKGKIFVEVTLRKKSIFSHTSTVNIVVFGYNYIL